MTSAAVELQKAVYATLSADAGLIALIGADRIHDHAPAHLAFPYVTFGRSTVSDWATSTEDGSEHIFTVHVWSNARGKSQALEIMAIIGGLLHDAELSVAEHNLINLRQEFEELRYDADNDVYHGTLRYRAVTEPAA
ncbi:DUF3168 domain-containing protein [Mesorhizobium sp. CAU 1741]|uniref:DUF3168 domain-containing protein n=1 Tax=Mesorhizobium sp. CAU 1741 TaxID=3140366 RepID=UPI00325B4D06